jgi:hypothetical protein
LKYKIPLRRHKKILGNGLSHRFIGMKRLLLYCLRSTRAKYWFRSFICPGYSKHKLQINIRQAWEVAPWLNVFLRKLLDATWGYTNKTTLNNPSHPYLNIYCPARVSLRLETSSRSADEMGMFLVFWRTITLQGNLE